MIGHQPFADWSALAAVGALDSDERQRFDAHLAVGCAECERDLAEWSAVAAVLPVALPAVEPPAGHRERMMARLDAETAASAPPRAVPIVGRRVPRWRWSGAVAAGLALAAALWGLWDTRSTLEHERRAIARLEQELVDQRLLTSLVSGKDTVAAPLAGTPTAARAGGWIVWSPSRHAGFIVVHYLPMLPPGRQYQLWAIAGGNPAPAGLFDVDEVGHAALIVSATVEQPDRFAVTIEPRGGRPSPTGPIAMANVAPIDGHDHSAGKKSTQSH